MFILLGLSTPTVASAIAVSVLYYQSPDNASMPLDYVVSVLWGVLGAFIGGYDSCHIMSQVFVVQCTGEAIFVS